MTDPPSPTPSRNLEGALWMLASAVTFSVMTSLIKFLGDDYPAALQTFYRQAAGLVVLLPLIARYRSAAFRVTRPGIVLFRSSAGTVAMILSFYAFQTLPLADANALSFTRILWMVPLAAFIMKEQVGWVRGGAALVGFAGVLIMVRPGAAGFEVGLPALAMLTSALLFAFTVTGLKVMSRDNAPIVILVWSTVLGVLFAIPGAILTWRVPPWPDLALLCAMGAIATVNQACFIKGMSLGDASAMAPIDYTRLIFAAVIGYAVFNEIPTVWTWVGAGVVVASTLFITLREQRLARSAKLTAEPDPH